MFIFRQTPFKNHPNIGSALISYGQGSRTLAKRGFSASCSSSGFGVAWWRGAYKLREGVGAAVLKKGCCICSGPSRWLTRICGGRRRDRWRAGAGGSDLAVVASAQGFTDRAWLQPSSLYCEISASFGLTVTVFGPIFEFLLLMLGLAVRDVLCSVGSPGSKASPRNHRKIAQASTKGIQRFGLTSSLCSAEGKCCHLASRGKACDTTTPLTFFGLLDLICSLLLPLSALLSLFLWFSSSSLSVLS